MSVELVLLAPALAGLLLLLAAGGRVVEAQGRLDGAARDAARAASLARQAPAAAARAAARTDLGPASWCVPGSVRTAVTAPSAPVTPGDSVTATVTCEVNMSPFTVLGFRSLRRFTGQAVAPLDPYVCRAARC